MLITQRFNICMYIHNFDINNLELKSAFAPCDKSLT